VNQHPGSTNLTNSQSQTSIIKQTLKSVLTSYKIII